MDMNVDIVKNLAKSANIMNTLNGGTIFPAFKHTKEEDHYRLEVSVPTVSDEDLKVEVINGDLLIYHSVSINKIPVPNVLGIFKISADVDIQSITAVHENDHLIILMPTSEISGDLDRVITILKR